MLVRLRIVVSTSSQTMPSLHGQQGRHHRGAYAAGNLQRAGGLGSVADHTGEVGDHILDGGLYLFESTSHKVDYAAGGTGGCDHTAAERGETAEALLDIDRGEV